MNSANSSDLPPFTSDESFTTHDGKEPPEEHWEAQDNQTLAAQQTITKQNLKKIRSVAATIDAELAIQERIFSLKQALNALAIPFTNELLYHALGVGASNYDDPHDSSTPFLLEEERWLVEGICKFGEFNLVTAEEKLGKTALGIHIAAASLRGESQCLGMPIRQHIDGIIILGPDGNKNEYGKILRREGLLVGTKLDPRVKLFCKGMKMPYFTEKGIAEICRLCSQFKRPLLIPDTLFKCTIPALINPQTKDTSPEYMIPHQNLEQSLQALAPDCVVTEWVCAHSKKGQGTGIQGRMRGTNQGTGDASHIIGINWVTPDSDSARTDFRRQVITDGRDMGDALICELITDEADGHWICHGNARETMAKESKRQMLEGMSDKRKNLWTWMQWKAVENIEGGTFDTGQCAKAGSMAFSSAWDVLKQWHAYGFIEKAGEVSPGPQGGRPNVIYRVAAEWVAPEEPPVRLRAESAQETELNRDKSVNSVFLSSGSLGVDPSKSVNSVPSGQSVEILMSNGTWQNSWIVTEGSTEHAVRVEKLGQPALTRSKLRWLEDVKPCTGSPYAVPATQPEPTYDSEDFI